MSNIHFTPITDDISSFDLSSSIKCNYFNSYHRNKTYGNRQLKNYQQGLIVDIIVNDLRISPDTHLGDIIEFKKRHKDELGLFRTELVRLTQGISQDLSIDAMRQQIYDVYTNDFLPAYNNFKRALKGLGIKWISDNFLRVSTFSIGATSVPTALMAGNVKQALLAGVGVSILASKVSYSVEKQKYIRESPYSYLLCTEQEWRI